MRILFINPVGQIGGAERVLVDCVAGIRKIDGRHQIHVLLMDDGPLLQAAREAGAEVLVLQAPTAIRSLGDSALKGGRLMGRVRTMARMVLALPAMWQYARRLRAAIQTIAPDVIHSNGLKSHLMTAQAGFTGNAGPEKSPQVYWHIHDFVGTRPMVARLLRRSARGVKTIAISKAVADDTRKWLPGSEPTVILNGIDLDRFRPAPGDDSGEDSQLDALSKLPLAAPGTLRVGLVATYARWKGQDVFLQAVARVMMHGPGIPARFYIIGGPIYTTAGSQFSIDELQSMARELGVEQHVGFVPFQYQMEKVYRSLDILVHASNQPEPFGLTIAEAMACGKAVVVSAAGGSRELFTDGVDGLGVIPGDPSTLADAIRKLMDDPTERVKMGQAARETAVRKFAREEMAGQILSLYQSGMNRN